MVTEFILPDVGEGIVECEIVEWLVKEGDVIVEDQPVADVQTDKALIQIPSKFNGTVHKLHYAQGELAILCMSPCFQWLLKKMTPARQSLLRQHRPLQANLLLRLLALRL